MERRKILWIRHRGDGFADRIERLIERRLLRNDLAALLVLHETLLADLRFPSSLLGRNGIGACRLRPETCGEKYGDDRSAKKVKGHQDSSSRGARA